MTRNRAATGDVPCDLTAAYYGARAAAGLIVTEGTSPARTARATAARRACTRHAQIAGWRRSDRCGARRRRLHRAADDALRTHRQPSQQGCGRAHGRAFGDPRAAGACSPTRRGWWISMTPEELATAEIAGVIGEYAHAARARATGRLRRRGAARGLAAICRCSSCVPARTAARDGYGGTSANRGCASSSRCLRGMTEGIGRGTGGGAHLPGQYLQRPA